LDTLDRRGSRYGFYFSFGLDRCHGHHHYHPYRRSDRGYFRDDINKSKAPTFDGYLNKPEDVEAWLLGLKKVFELHDYIENMKAMIVIFSLKGKVNIWWEDVKHLRDLMIEELIWHEFKRLFRKKYLLEWYYMRKANYFLS